MLPKYPPELKEQIIICKSPKGNIIIVQFPKGSHDNPAVPTHFKQSLYITEYSQ